MTDPKSISRNREHYTEQYGVQPLNRNQSVNGTYESAVGETVDIDGSAVPDEYQEFFAESSGAPADGNLLGDLDTQEIQSAMQGDAAPIQWDETTQTLQSLNNLIGQLKKPRSEKVLTDETRDDFVTKAKKAFTDLKNSGRLPEEQKGALLEEIGTLIDAATAALEEGESEQAEKVASAGRVVTGLLTKVEKSRLSSAQKEGFTSRPR